MLETAFARMTLCILALTTLTSCQTPRHDEFARVKQGMEKDLVLEAAGNPTIARRWQGKDRWIYEYRETPNGPQTREVHFQDGRAVYVGTKVVPDVSAEDQDRLNDEANEKVAKEIAADTAKWANTVGAVTAGGGLGAAGNGASGANGVSPAGSATGGANLVDPRFDADFRESTYGIPKAQPRGYEAIQ